MRLGGAIIAALTITGSHTAAAWEVDATPDRLGRTSHAASVTSSPVSGDEPAMLFVLCEANVTGVGLSWDTLTFGPYLTPVVVAYRIDDNDAREATFEVVERSLFLDKASRFAKDLIGAKRIYLEASDITGHLYSAEFDISSAGGAFKGIRSECGW